MSTEEKNWLEQVVNVSIVREKKRVYVNFSRQLPLLEREYHLLEYLLREPDIRKAQVFNEIARGAFRKTEMVPISSVEILLRRVKSQLVRYGAYRGFLTVSGRNSVQLYAPEPSVKVTAFHVPSTRYKAGPTDGSQSFGREDVEPVWEGQVTEKGDAQIRGEIFQFLNRDDRPNGRFAPSLSVGDVVTIAGGTIEAVSFQVATVGWTHLERPVHADPKAVEAMKERLADRPQTVALNT